MSKKHCQCDTIKKYIKYANSKYEYKFDNDKLPTVDNIPPVELGIPPLDKIAVVTCMDARVNPYLIFNIPLGAAHVIKNAGGVVTDDVIRSLTISQRLLGTTQIIVMHHFDCGMRTFNNDEFTNQLEVETCQKPEFSFETFSDPAQDVRQSIQRILNNPFIAEKSCVTGLVYMDKPGEIDGVFYDAGQVVFIAKSKKCC